MNATALDEIFTCTDQSALIDNYVSSEDPPPGAWSHHAAPQSPLGRVRFPDVVTLSRGDVYTPAGAGQLTEHMLTGHTWTPWRYSGAGDAIAVERAVTQDSWAGSVKLKHAGQGLLVIECELPARLGIVVRRADDGLCFTWGEFRIWLTSNSATTMLLSDDPASINRRFAGYDDVPMNERHIEWALAHLGRIWIGVPFETEVVVHFDVMRGGGERRPARDIDSMAAAERQRWASFFEDLAPKIETADPVIRDTYHFAWSVIWSNRCLGGSRRLPHPFISPARLSYGSQWWWDSAFHALILGRLADGNLCYGETENLWRAQQSDGSVPGALVFTAGEDDVARTAGANPWTMTLPPVIGFIMVALAENPGWPDDLRPLYDRLLAYAHWNGSDARDADCDGLADFRHNHDTGSDQSSRWDHFKHDHSKVMDALYPVEAVDLNVWISELWRALSLMAAQLGDDAATAAHEAKARATFALVDQHMWDEADGIYYDIDSATHEMNRVKSFGAFMPMLSPYARPERIDRLIEEHLLNPAEFWTQYPVPSIALTEPTFDPIDMFRGPSWVNLNWMIIEGLHRQKKDDLARDLARRTLAMVGSRYDDAGCRIRTPRLWEWYHPFSGEALGNSQYSWSALVIDLILRFLT